VAKFVQDHYERALLVRGRAACDSGRLTERAEVPSIVRPAPTAPQRGMRDNTAAPHFIADLICIAR
jgi:hypothetical protein